MKRDCLKKKADDAKGNKKPNGRRLEGGGGGGAPPRAALAYAASAGQARKRNASGSTSGSSTWVLDSGSTNHMAAQDADFTVKMTGSGAKVTVAVGHKVPIKGHGYASMDVGKGNTTSRMVLDEAMLVPDLTDNVLSVRAVDRCSCAGVFVGNACYTLSDGEAVLASGVLSIASVVGSVNESENYVLKVLWAEALSSVIPVLNRSPKAGQHATPLEALTGRRPDVKTFRVWRSRAWALKPKQRQRKLGPRTDVGRFFGCTFGEKTYSIREDGSNRVFERRDVLMDVTSGKAIRKTSVPGPASTHFLTGQTDGDREDGAMDMLDAEAPSGDEYASQQSSESDVRPNEANGLEEEDGDGNDAGEDTAAHDGHDVLPGSTTESGEEGVQAPRRSKRKPAPKGTWWERKPTAYVA